MCDVVQSAKHTPQTLPPGTKLVVLSDGRAGHDSQTFGLAAALGVEKQVAPIAPRGLFKLLAPFGPVDPRDAAFVRRYQPDIVLAAGRRTIPALRYMKKIARGKTFTVYLNKPHNGLGAADLIIAPSHDALSGANVISTITPVNSLTESQLAAARKNPDPRIGALPGKRVALLIGGDSHHFKFTPQVQKQLTHIARQICLSGASLMATPSRRTPPSLIDMLKDHLQAFPSFLWDGTGENPYLSLLACADAFLITADSVNMISEAASTGAPIHIFTPPGGHQKLIKFQNKLAAAGAARLWRGAFEDWRYDPINATPMIAQSVISAYNQYVQQSST